MTVEQLNKANEIQKEIEQINEIFSMLDSTIVFEEDRGTPIKSFLRFINGRLKLGEDPKAHVILFRDNKTHGYDIPVDLDFLKLLRSYYQKCLNDKKKELGDTSYWNAGVEGQVVFSDDWSMNVAYKYKKFIDKDGFDKADSSNVVVSGNWQATDMALLTLYVDYDEFTSSTETKTNLSFEIMFFLQL